MENIEDRDRVFAANLAAELEKRNLKQNALAKTAKVNAITINRILKLKQPAGRKVARAISDALGLQPEELYRSPQSGQSLDPEIIEAIERGAAQVISRVAAPAAEYESAVSIVGMDLIEALAKQTPQFRNGLRKTLGIEPAFKRSKTAEDD